MSQDYTFRLADSLPLEVLKRFSADTTSVSVRREKVERFLDSGHGSCWLAREELARIIENAFFHFDGERYRLISWCVMPNHVHVLVEIGPEQSLADIVQSWKSFTAKKINRVLERSGIVWEADYFDRYIRDDLQLFATREYIENNPVGAGLVDRKERWPYSSAFKEADGTSALQRPGTGVLRKGYTLAR